VNKFLVVAAALLIGYVFPILAKLTIHNGTPYPIKVRVVSAPGIKDHVVEVDPLSKKEIMTGAAAGVCITKYKVWVKESGMNDYPAEDYPTLEQGKLSDCGFRKHLIVTALKDTETGNFIYHLSHAAMAAGKLGVHVHNGTDSKIKVEINRSGVPKKNKVYELKPGESADVLGGQFAGNVIKRYKVWVMPFGEDKYKEKEDADIKGNWIGYNKQLFIIQQTALDGSLMYKFEAEAYA